MSERLDIVIVTDHGFGIHHQSWGASGLFAQLLAGPERALEDARSFGQTTELDDSMAAAVIDLARRRLVIAGSAEVVSDAGPRRVQPQELLGELATAWPGWGLAYEPNFVIEPVILYLAGVGHSIASLHAPHAVADHLGRPRFQAPEYTLDAPVESA